MHVIVLTVALGSLGCAGNFLPSFLPNYEPARTEKQKFCVHNSFVLIERVRKHFRLTISDKVDASRRAEKCLSLRVQVEDGVSGCA